MDQEIKEFTEGIGAYEPDGDGYILFRSLFKKSNYFLFKDRFMIVKVSRSPRPFWGVGKKFLTFFKKLESNYLLVLLVSGREGWVFDKRDVEYNIEKGFWKLNPKDENYKINLPLKDKHSFSTHQQFLKKLESDR
jgi:hypothetical protein